METEAVAMFDISRDSLNTPLGDIGPHCWETQLKLMGLQIPASLLPGCVTLIKSLHSAGSRFPRP